MGRARHPRGHRGYGGFLLSWQHQSATRRGVDCPALAYGRGYRRNSSIAPLLKSRAPEAPWRFLAGVAEPQQPKADRRARMSAIGIDVSGDEEAFAREHDLDP